MSLINKPAVPGDNKAEDPATETNPKPHPGIAFNDAAEVEITDPEIRRQVYDNLENGKRVYVWIQAPVKSDGRGGGGGQTQPNSICPCPTNAPGRPGH